MKNPKKRDRDFYDGEAVLLDLGIADVHTAGSMGEEVKPVWVQIAKQGAFAGHAAGPFKLDLSTFSEIISNFRATENRRIPWDFEHASEKDPTQGSIPVAGAPAQGWITEMKIGDDGNLYGLTSWGDLARQYVREGKYRYCSPAIRFESKDRVTGKPIGARLTSVALTNEPFLDGMEPLAAKDAEPGAKLTLARCMSDLRKCMTDHASKSGSTCRDLHIACTTALACYEDADDGDVSMKLRDAEGEAARSTLLLREATATIEAQAEELRALREEKAARDERDVLEDVQVAFDTYKDTKKLADPDRALLLSWRRSDPAGFRKMYPAIRPVERHLLRSVVPPEVRPRATSNAAEVAELARRLMSERGLSWIEAKAQAAQQLRSQAGAR
jgi:phage I-like protein